MELKRDTLLQGGRYRIVDSIGRGGFGITYLAEQVMARRRVCIKEFFPKDYYKREGNTGSLTLSSEGFGEAMNKFKAKFIKEAQTIAALDHPNIIHIHDVFEENGTAYYVMDYIEGESLSELVKRDGAMSERDAVAYIKQVAAALEHIHEQQIMHLDVKPDNIMVRTKDSRSILIDFGLSKHYDAESGEATSTTPVGVSHGYAPMEQYQDGGVSTFSPETDIYSLGATLYYLVTGNVPPQATAVAEQGLPQLGALSSNIRETIERSMSYLRKDRPHTIKEFLALLDSEVPVIEVLVADDEKTIIAPQTPAPKRGSNEDKPKPKKHRWWLLLLLLLLIGVVRYLMYMHTAKPQLDTFEQIDSDSTTLNQLRQDSINMAIHDNAIRDSIARVEREQFVRDSTDRANAAAEQKKREEEARKAEQQRIDNMVAQGLGRDGVYQIGDYYNVNGKQGVVFEVRDGGRHGKIVSLDETETRWDSHVELTVYGLINGTKTEANSYSDGKANTAKIMSCTDSQYFEAFVWCRNKGADWYLPATEELKAIPNNKSKINFTLAKYGTKLNIYGYYWSSTENGEFNAWCVNLYGGDTVNLTKSNARRVRAVSAF